VRAAGAAVAIGAAVVAVRRLRPFRVEISGDSMAPALRSGDVAVAVAIGAPRVGDVVVFEHPGRPGLELVKRVVAGPGELGSDARVLGAGEWWVEGDDPLRSTDSRHFGPVRVETVRARVVLVAWPPSRLRVLRSGLRA
jgi:hypothetical protein